MKKDTNNEINITAEELFGIMLGVEKLRKFYKAHPILYLQLARCNGKTLSCMRFIRRYTAIIRAYEKADRKAAKADKKALRQYERKKETAARREKAHHVIFDESPQFTLWQTVTCWRCASPIYRRTDARVHHVDGDRSRRVYVCAACHLKLHEKNKEEPRE